MSYRVEVRRYVSKKIISWNLPDPVLVEVYLRLRENLSSNPAEHLRRTRRPFEGMVCEFAFIDPENRICEHVFCFLVLYSQDEESVIIANGGYERRVGM
jgi:hypothetical protein